MADIADSTDKTFPADVLQSALPVLVEFGAEWCHPCRQLDPIVEELAAEWKGRLKIVRLDIDANVETTMKYGVMGVPTLMLFVEGDPRERITGYQPKKRIVEKLAPHLGF